MSALQTSSTKGQKSWSALRTFHGLFCLKFSIQKLVGTPSHHGHVSRRNLRK
ncbi:hypothetical protein MTR67_051970 [Solanum verrucosum]|uniref:Uncharacterized protein n=1 Tax=Solanum verrucosum TaxID=315347 RepID=A0AAF0V4X5_SOLVR|nr:hypothetical protein MTR67_051970 [Solanum verrucosum]